MARHFAILLAATLLDRLVGDPDWLWRRIPHPVAWMGAAIDALDRRFNRPELSERRRRWNGLASLLLLLSAALSIGLTGAAAFRALGLAGAVLEALAVAVFLAQKSLADHVRGVAEALRTGGLPAGRRAVSMIVGRDPEQLDEAGICRAAVESLAENASDGVVAPWLFYLLFGLPGLLVYKAVNTADSMVGHLSERHRAFGWAAAKTDDLLNWPAARLTALMIAAAALLRTGNAGAIGALRAARRDAPLHRSPNAGWPEAAMAGALGLALGGPRRYGEVEVDAPLLHPEGRRESTPGDIAKALRLFELTTLQLSAAAGAMLGLALL